MVSVSPPGAPGSAIAPTATGETVPLYLTPAEVAEMLRVSTKSVSRWALQDPTMPAIRLGRVVRCERAALEAWLARKQPRLTQGARKERERSEVSA